MRFVNWVAASLFFLAGSMLYVTPVLIRSLLYAARMSTGSWSYPDELLERMVPTGLQAIAIVAFGLCAVAILLPLVPWAAKPLPSAPPE